MSKGLLKTQVVTKSTSDLQQNEDFKVWSHGQRILMFHSVINII
jgi:hypothetical protein